MSVQRKFERHRLGVVLKSRKRGLSRIIKTEDGRELHATKGWRMVPKVYG